jgi:hypothetical protein
MRRIRPEFLDADPSDRSVAADVLVREEPEEEENDDDDEEGDGAKKKRAKTTTRATQSDHRVSRVVLSFVCSIATSSQDRRRFLSDARAAPRAGTTTNSSRVTSQSST